MNDMKFIESAKRFYENVEKYQIDNPMNSQKPRNEYAEENMRTELLKKAISSSDYRKYIEKNKIELSDWHLATLIYHNKSLAHEEVLSALHFLGKNTSDKKLEMQIYQRLIQDVVFYEAFKRTADNAYFQVSCLDKLYEQEYIFTNFDDAYQVVLKADCPTRIIRCAFDGKSREDGVWGSIEYSTDGKIQHHFLLWRSGGNISIDDGDRNRFEGRGLDLPLMFRTGDIVYIPHENTYGIVVALTDQDDEKRMRKLAIYEYADFQVPVNYVYQKGKYKSIFSHGHVSPADIEYANLAEGDTRKGFLEYLAQRILMESRYEFKTRAPQRMDEVLRMIKEIWEQYPDFRLGQLFVNVCGKKDLFYVEDEDLVKALQRNKFPIEEE